MAGIGEWVNEWNRFFSVRTIFRVIPSGSTYSKGSKGFSNLRLAVEEKLRRGTLDDVFAGVLVECARWEGSFCGVKQRAGEGRN